MASRCQNGTLKRVGQVKTQDDSRNELLKDIQVAERQLENGEGIPHEEARKRLLQKARSRSGS